MYANLSINYILISNLRNGLNGVCFCFMFTEWSNVTGHDRVKRQLSVSSDSKLLDDDIREETKVILRPRKPPRPKSEVLLNQGSDHRRTKRFSAFGVRYFLCLRII